LFESTHPEKEDSRAEQSRSSSLIQFRFRKQFPQQQQQQQQQQQK